MRAKNDRKCVVFGYGRILLSYFLTLSLVLFPVAPYADALPNVEPKSVSSVEPKSIEAVNVRHLADGSQLAHDLLEKLKKDSAETGRPLGDYRVIVNYFGKDLADLPSQLERYVLVLRQNGISKIEFRHVLESDIEAEANRIMELRDKATERASKAWLEIAETPELERDYIAVMEAAELLRRERAASVDGRIGNLAEKVFRYVLRLQLAKVSAEDGLPIAEKSLDLALENYEAARGMSSEKQKVEALGRIIQTLEHSAKAEQVQATSRKEVIAKLGEGLVHLMELPEKSSEAVRQKAVTQVVSELYNLAEFSLDGFIEKDGLEFASAIQRFSIDLRALTELMEKEGLERHVEPTQAARGKLAAAAKRIFEKMGFGKNLSLIEENSNLFTSLDSFSEILEKQVYRDGIEAQLSNLQEALDVLEMARLRRHEDPEAYRRAYSNLAQVRAQVLEFHLQSYKGKKGLSRSAAEAQGVSYRELEKSSVWTRIGSRIRHFYGIDKLRWNGYSKLITDKKVRITGREFRIVTGLMAGSGVVTGVLLWFGESPETTSVGTGILTAMLLRGFFSLGERGTGFFATQGLNFHPNRGFVDNSKLFITTHWTHSIVYSMTAKMGAMTPVWLGVDWAVARGNLAEIFGVVVENSILGVIGKQPILQKLSGDQDTDGATREDSKRVDRDGSMNMLHGFTALWMIIKFAHLYKFQKWGFNFDYVLWVMAGVGAGIRYATHLKDGRVKSVFNQSVRETFERLRQAARDKIEGRPVEKVRIVNPLFKETAREVIRRDNKKAVKFVTAIPKKTIEVSKRVGDIVAKPFQVNKVNKPPVPGMIGEGDTLGTCFPIMVSILRKN